MEIPEWLPALIPVSGYWPRVEQLLYDIFHEDFLNAETKCWLYGLPIWCDRRVLVGNREEGFWHLVTCTDQYSGQRLPDLRRAERLAWCGAMIRNTHEPEVKVWEYREGTGRVRTYLWFESEDYVVILEKRSQRFGEIYFLITAYYADGASTKRGLARKYQSRLDED